MSDDRKVKSGSGLSWVWLLAVLAVLVAIGVATS
jgi:hypothetical protein